jgi:DNA replication protein DnaC
MNTQQTLNQMRELKLSGMAGAYEAFLTLPYEQQATSPFHLTLAAFIEAELLERYNRRLLSSIRAAHFRYQASLEEIEYLPERNLDKNLLLQLSQMSFVKRAENVLISGATGSGKSFLSTALGYRACEQGYKVGYYSMPKLMGQLQLCRADGSLWKMMKGLEKLHLLILDDWGIYPMDSATRLSLLQLMEDRHGKQATVITSQLPVSKWYEYIGDPTIADAVMDRILQKAHRIELKGESMRKRTKAEKKENVNQ